MTRFNTQKKYLLITAVVLTAFTGGYIVYHFKTASDYAGAISTDIKSVADFKLYMPRKLPQGFVLKKDSISYKGDILFVQFVKDDQQIFMSQQKKPNAMPPISTLKGFSQLPVKIGYAVSGEQEGVSAVIINTNSSLITVTGDKTIASSELALFAKRLEQIN